MTSFKLPPKKKHPDQLRHFATILLCAVFHLKAAELPAEKPLWKGNPGGPAIELDLESVRQLEASVHSPSGSNRVFSQVSEPSYTIHQASKATATGVGLVLCPGGGYRDVWLDREGHDLGIWLQKQGITTLVLKYRTNYRPNQSEPATLGPITSGQRPQMPDKHSRFCARKPLHVIWILKRSVLEDFLQVDTWH